MIPDQPSGPPNLRGCLILADPGLKEPTFRQTVILVTEFDTAQGAQGYILNRPLGKTVGDLLYDPEFEGLSDIPVFMGGPVSTEHLTFGSLGWCAEEDRLLFSTHLSAPQALRNKREGFSVRAFVGYSGWSEGQLESELERHTWIVREFEKPALETAGIEKLWNRLLRPLSPWHAIVADEPDDVSMN